MSMIIAGALALSVASPTPDQSIGRQDWPHVVAAARRADVPPMVLYHAMTEPTAALRPRHAARLCIRRGDIVPGKAGMVCRTREEWAWLGIEITAPKG